ncbi:MAG: hypothetical protein H0X13_18675 [Ramlibacter sp.]|nr:hypothetical protein [Ramlibacter sp.]
MRAAVTPELSSVLRCPHCGGSSREQMPEDACTYFHECRHCKQLISPQPRHCCVFCSYGSVPCPPVQVAGGCCGV